MPNFNDIFNQELINTSIIEAFKNMSIILWECLKMPIIPITENIYIPFGILLLLSILIGPKSTKRFRY